MWSQSVNVFDPYAAIVNASEKTETSNKRDTTEDHK